MQIVTPRHTVPISQVRNILQGALARGLDAEAILLKAGIPPLLLISRLSRVSQAQFARLLRNLQRQMRDEYWGLCSHPVRYGTFAQCCELMVHSATLGDALRAAFHFYHLIVQDFTVRLQRDGDNVWVRIQPEVPATGRSEYAIRVFMFFAYGVACWLVEERIPVRQVCVRAARPSEIGLTDLLFNAPASFGCDFDGFCFDHRWLDCAVRQDTDSLPGFLNRAPGDLLIRYRDRTRIAERVRRYLRQHLNDGSVPVEQVAESFGMTPYTLRRRLRLEHERFQDLKDELRRDAAIEYLNCPNLSLTEVADRLGFSEPSTFHRAFKKWTGLPPGEYRHTLLLDEAPLVAG